MKTFEYFIRHAETIGTLIHTKGVGVSLKGPGETLAEFTISVTGKEHLFCLAKT